MQPAAMKRISQTAHNQELEYAGSQPRYSSSKFAASGRAGPRRVVVPGGSPLGVACTSGEVSQERASHWELDAVVQLRQAVVMTNRGIGELAKRVLFVWLASALSLSAWAWEDTRVRKHPLFSDEYVIEKDGRREGTIRRNPLFPDQWDVYDNSGQRQGTVRQNPLFKDELDVYAPSGTREKTVRQNPLFKDELDVYDRTGRRTERIRRNPLFPDEWRIDRLDP